MKELEDLQEYLDKLSPKSVGADELERLDELIDHVRFAVEDERVESDQEGYDRGWTECMEELAADPSLTEHVAGDRYVQMLRAAGLDSTTLRAVDDDVLEVRISRADIDHVYGALH